MPRSSTDPEQRPDAVSTAELMAFLQDPASYPHPPASVHLVQTHASVVAVVPPYVYKVKKPVDLGFLDFSTLTRRRHFCEQEVALNRRLCSRIYEGVVPIRCTAGRLAFEGAGPVVEYAVKMKALAPEGFLDHLLARHAAGTPEIDRVADRLVSFYRGQATTPEISAWGHVEKLRLSTDENFAQTAPFVGDALPRPAYESVRHYTEAFYRHRAALLERRVRQGFILDCHGDLHTEHVHLSEAGVCIYDCIEFNERFRYIDVANDVAFLAMDLHFNGRPDLSRYLVRRVAEALDDADLSRLLPFYACYRAYVRCKVALMRSCEAEVPEDERAESRTRARRYLQLALNYAVADGAPMVLAVTGRVGTGKSTIAGALSDLLGWEIAASDRTRKTLAGVPLYERPDAAERAGLYAPAMSDRTYAVLLERALANAAEGRGTILDATYGRRRHREALRGALGKASLPCFFVELTAPDAVLHGRLRQREHEKQVLSDARLEDFEALDKRYEPPSPEEGPHLIQASSEQEVDRVLLSILKTLITLRLHGGDKTDVGDPSLRSG